MVLLYNYRYISHTARSILCLYTECDKNADTVSILIIQTVETEPKILLCQTVHKFRKFNVNALENDVLQLTSMTRSTFFSLQSSLDIV
jgi:hypothetical protein